MRELKFESDDVNIFESLSFIWPAIIGAVGSIAGGLISKSGQDSANDDMIELANTQYQRSMTDMDKAGLNPILAYKQAGAPTPALNNPSAKLGNSIATGTNSALDSLAKNKQLDLMDAQIEKTNAEKRLTDDVKEETVQRVKALEWSNRLNPANYATAMEKREMEKFEYSLTKKKNELREKWGSKIYDGIDSLIKGSVDGGKSLSEIFNKEYWK